MKDWLAANYLHVGAWVGGVLAVAMGFYDVEWGHRLGAAAPVLIAGGLGAFGVSGAFAAGVKVPPPAA